MKRIETNTHLLLVDETAEIKKNDWFINTSSQIIHKSEGIEIFDYRKNKQVNFKIILAFPNLKDLPKFETLPYFNTEDYIKKLADKKFKYKFDDRNSEEKNKEWQIRKLGFIDGYKQALKNLSLCLNTI